MPATTAPETMAVVANWTCVLDAARDRNEAIFEMFRRLKIDFKYSCVSLTAVHSVIDATE